MSHCFALRGEDEKIRPAVVRVRDPPDEPSVDEPLDVVAKRRRRDARCERDRRRAHRPVVADMRQEGEEKSRDADRFQLLVDDLAHVLRRRPGLEEELSVRHCPRQDRAACG